MRVWEYSASNGLFHGIAFTQRHECGENKRIACNDVLIRAAAYGYAYGVRATNQALFITVCRIIGSVDVPLVSIHILLHRLFIPIFCVQQLHKYQQENIHSSTVCILCRTYINPMMFGAYLVLVCWHRLHSMSMLRVFIDSFDPIPRKRRSKRYTLCWLFDFSSYWNMNVEWEREEAPSIAPPLPLPPTTANTKYVRDVDTKQQQQNGSTQTRTQSK